MDMKMNILLVDDDSYVLEAIQSALDWEKLGIAEIYTACCVKQAKKIIEDVKIHILICDIEMPKENGFELISWIKEKRFLMKDILLTSYAEFEYANKAIQLNIFAYALKPIDYEKLSEIIAKAIEKEKELLESEDYRKVYDTWNESEKNRKEFFWRSLLVDKRNAGPAEIENEIRQSHFSYQHDMFFLPFIFEYAECEERIKSLGAGMFLWTVRNITEELFTTEEFKVECIITEMDKSGTAILSLKNAESRNQVILKAEEFIRQTEKYFHGYWSITIGAVCSLLHITAAHQRILDVNQQEVTREGHVVLEEKCHMKEVSYHPPKWKLWGNFMADLQTEPLIEEVFKYLDYLTAHNQINRMNLSQFLMEFMQNYIAALRVKELDYAMDVSEYHIEAMKNKVHSVRSCKTYIAEMIRKTMWIARQKTETLSLAEVVRQYIDNHLEEEVTRESLAEIAFLNPDYLARIFKKEVGESIGTYILNRRMDMAKEYLAKTEEPINIIATKVGYDNFSYFSKVFKTETAMSPKEYRRKYHPNPVS